MKVAHLCIALVAVVLYSCSPDRGPDIPPSQTEVRLRDSLALLKADYDALRLFDALARARSLRAQTEVLADSLRPELRAEVYQYLAMLHFEREHWLDSIRYYAIRADSLMTPAARPVMAARQSLCWAYVSYHDWAMREMELYTALGLRQLESAENGDPHLRGLLLTARGSALKQLGDRIKDEAAQDTVYQRSEAAFRGGLEVYRAAGLSRYDQALEELGVLLTRMPARRDEVDALVRELRTRCETGAAEQTRLLRLLAYSFRKREESDSAIVYHRKLADTDHFADGYLQEGQYYLLQLLSEAKRFSEALTVNDAIVDYYDCCPPGTSARQCSQDTRCVFVQSEHAEVLRQRFLHTGDPHDLREAYRLSMRAVQGYQEALSRISDEGTYTQTVEHGDPIITTAVRTIYGMQEAALLRPDSLLAAAFQTVEFGKAHSLALELSQLARQRADDGNRKHYLELSEVRKAIDLLKGKSARNKKLSGPELASFAELMRQRRPLTATSAAAFAVAQRGGETPFGTPPPVAAVQVQLTEREALLEWLETPDAVYGLYVDRDTIVAYAVDSSVRSAAVTFQELVQDPNSDLSGLASAGTALFTRLFGPVAEYLEKRPHLILSPSESLQALPMAALRVAEGDSSRYLVQRHTLRYVDSWRTECIYAGQRRSFATSPIASVGIWTHPELTRYLGSLAGTLLTDHALAGDHFTEADATGTSLLTESSRYDLLQLSVHARGNLRQLNENYLYLSPQDSISGVQIGALLLRARLVVLAACSTARGLSERREGTYSLRRSFHLAGVPDVVASQFDIPAAATEELIEQFYVQLFERRSPEEALSRAQQQFASPTGSYRRWRHPHFWAGLSLN